MTRNEAIAHVLQQLSMELISIDASGADEVKFRTYTAKHEVWSFTLPVPMDMEMPREAVDSYIAIWRARTN